METEKENTSEMIPVNTATLAGNEAAYVNDCVESGWISSAGKYIERFEEDWAQYCGMTHGIAVSNGTAALQIAVDALRLEPGDEVIMPSFTIISCVLAVMRAGAVPVVVDCDAETYCIDVVQAAAAVTPRTRAIMPVHMYGHPANMDALLSLAEQHDLAIIEDAAQAHGSEYFSRRGASHDWRRCGGLGTLSAFSFYANKLITTGEGGMVLTNDAELAVRCRGLRNLCFQSPRFCHDELGYNFRLTNIQAAVGVAQIERIGETIWKKRSIGAHYDTLLASVRTLKLPSIMSWARVNYCMYPIVLTDETVMNAVEFAERLKEKGVDTRPFFMGLHEQPVLRARGIFRRLELPVTERLYRRGLYLPFGQTLTTTQIEFVANAVKDVLA